MNLNQVTLPSIDIERATSFYKLMGFNLIVNVFQRYVRFEFRIGGSTFSIHRVDALPKNEGITIYFENDNLDILVKQLQEKDIIFTQEPKDIPWLWRKAHLRDPDGNKTIICKAGKNRKNPPWRIN